MFYEPSKKKQSAVLDEFESIDDDAERTGMVMVKVTSAKVAKTYGLIDLPAVVHFQVTSLIGLFNNI